MSTNQVYRHYVLGVAALACLAASILVPGCTLQDLSYLGRGSTHQLGGADAGGEGGSGAGAGVPAGGNTQAGGSAAGLGGGANGGTATGGSLTGGTASGGIPTGGTGACPSAVGSGTAGLIDDFEDDNVRIAVRDGRTGQLSLESGYGLTGAVGAPGSNSSKALHLASTQAITRAPIFARFSLNEPEPGLVCTYDASRYNGLSFAVKGTTPFTIGVQTYDTIGTPTGGCTNACAPFRYALTPGADWTLIMLGFSQLKQDAPGTPAAVLDTRRLMYVELDVDRSDQPVELWIDDLAFY